MRVEEVRVLSSIPQLHLSATNETHLSSVVPSVEHLCRVAHPIQVSVKHLHDVALATRLRLTHSGTHIREVRS